jgi:AAHS family 4-hydroxybenzoate transporter-like MFS transporter
MLVFLDGYDITAISFAAPELVKAWGIADYSAFGPVFGASLVGMLVGAPTFGYFGDRYGRKAAIVTSCIIIGVFTLAMTLATSLSHLIIMRFIAGIGMGGLLPNASALNAEYAPRRYRATMIIMMYIGTALGGAVPGPIAAALVPLYGWQILFLIGGVLPLLGAILACLQLPESVKYLVLKGGRDDEVARLVNSISPRERVSSAHSFVVGTASDATVVTPRLLFKDGLRIATPLLWLLFFANLMGYFFLLNWTPLLLVGANVPIAKAALALSIFQIGGIFGGLCVMRPMDRWGVRPIIVLFIVAVPIIGSIGFVGSMGSEALLLAIIFLGGFCTLAIQLGLNAMSAMIYPTAVRASGAGWALGVGRIGSVAGPLVGGWLIAANLPVQTLYLFASAPFLVGALAGIALGVVSKLKFGGELLTAGDHLATKPSAPAVSVLPMAGPRNSAGA